MKKSVRQALVAGTFAVAVGGGIVAASAATLGTLTSTNLGAASSVVAACDTNGVDIAYTTAYNATAHEYVIDTATVSSINAACDGQSMKVQLYGAAGVVEGSQETETLDASGTRLFTFGTAAVSNVVTGAAIVISGTIVP